MSRSGFRDRCPTAHARLSEIHPNIPMRMEALLGNAGDSGNIRSNRCLANLGPKVQLPSDHAPS